MEVNMSRADQDLEDRMVKPLMRALRPVLFAFEEQDVQTQAVNSAILEKVARAAWREFRDVCTQITAIEAANIAAAKSATTEK